MPVVQVNLLLLIICHPTVIADESNQTLFQRDDAILLYERMHAEDNIPTNCSVRAKHPTEEP